MGAAITKNLPLVCLIVVVGVLGIPIGLGNYHEHLAGITSRFEQKPQVFYLFITGLVTLIGPIVNLGSLYIIHPMLEKLKLPDRLLGRVYVRGFTSVHTWSPYFMSVFLVVYSLNIPIHQYLPYGLLLSFFQISTGYLLFRYVEMRKMALDTETGEGELNTKKLSELVAVLLLLTACIFILERFIAFNISVFISVIVLFFAFLWTAYLKLPKQFFTEVNNYRTVIFPNRANEVNLLLTAGFFGVVLSHTPLSHHVHHLWVGLADTSVLFLIVSTIAIIALLAFFGIHQIVTISAIVAMVSYDELGIHILIMAMMLLSAWSVATTISPVSPVIIAVANLLKVDVFRVILRWNLLYAAGLLLIHSIVIYCVHLFWFS